MQLKDTKCQVQRLIILLVFFSITLQIDKDHCENKMSVFLNYVQYSSSLDTTIFSMDHNKKEIYFLF